MTTTASPALPFLLADVEVASVDRLSPSFVRLELASPALADLGLDGPILDQRIKLVFPHADGLLPSIEGADESWTATWMERPVEERGHMRTYTVRDVRGTGVETRLVLDVVLHEGDGLQGPGAAWAANAKVGDRVIVLAPRRGHGFGGVEFVPGTARELLLVGDETAVPAVAGILRDLPATARGAAFLEVPRSGDVQTIQHPEGVSVTWLPRDGAERGTALHQAVLDHLGASAVPNEDHEVDDDLWETPTYSSSGEPVQETVSVVGHDLAGLYAWIAGEAKVVTGLRRALVRDLGVDRHQVAFMGYWRSGVAMRS
ncbi:siderophore-interacting protein [Nocardioides psychrotolerans]|uniref:NADPH-dependent ferric siderophore reductase, contains FAD-binding and SIP domains n=1 Tax=Nocardioides psychrotolerans TaxID=1005945 RepID=A0A1I3PJE7_9ACTN|nr:siderophore-interacting protein [Nocardioides psychrotolerans]GEP39680.1 siderophore-interacting protein [Nocardioides psychrotolerans]SFJ21603.1 NADPH-dependent ferric siderophore reductase, contains FAD-binding and SIP domains [Nocardioides psychrotolerans]